MKRPCSNVGHFYDEGFMQNNHKKVMYKSPMCELNNNFHLFKSSTDNDELTLDLQNFIPQTSIESHDDECFNHIYREEEQINSETIDQSSCESRIENSFNTILRYFPLLSHTKSLNLSCDKSPEFNSNKILGGVKLCQSLLANKNVLELDTDISRISCRGEVTTMELVLELGIDCNICLQSVKGREDKDIANCTYCTRPHCSASCGSTCDDCQRTFCRFCIFSNFDRAYECSLCMECS